MVAGFPFADWGVAGPAPDLTAQSWWFYRQCDRLRCRQGEVLEALGFGPRPVASRLVAEWPGARVHAYRERGEPGPVVLLVPAPIKRAYLWDLAPGASVVRRLLAAGLYPYLLEWTEPDPDSGLARYAHAHLEAAVAAVRREAGVAALFLAGHSLGGLLAAVFASLEPAVVKGVVALASPMHFSFDGRDGALGPVLGRLAAGGGLETLPGNLPGAFLSIASFAAAPASFGVERQLDWLRSLADPRAVAGCLRVERWSLDEMPLARRFVVDVVGELYGRDAFLAGSLRLGARTAAASALSMPLFLVSDPRCPVVPPAAAEPLLAAAGSNDRELVHYEGDIGVAIQHVGPLVGRNALGRLWPRIVGWMKERDDR